MHPAISPNDGAAAEAAPVAGEAQPRAHAAPVELRAEHSNPGAEPAIEAPDARPLPPLQSFYFDAFEERRPRPPMPAHAGREWALQAVSTCAVVLGVWYLGWRWTSSVNWDQWYVGVPLIVAETLAFFGTVLFFTSTAKTRDTPTPPPPARLSDITEAQVPEGDRPADGDRPLTVDLFIPTFNEDPELVRVSIRDAKAMSYPHPIDLRVHVLDDGKRAVMHDIAVEEGVGYLTRSSNIGYKAGNLRNALELTHGDLLVICDADTRVFPHFLTRTLGYFRDPKVAWVQTPQWFYDLDEGTPLPDWLGRRLHLGALGRALGRGVQRVFGEIRMGKDPLGNDPEMFYDVILRRRSWANAAFCCGAGSVHRREAVMEAALKAFAEQVDKDVARAIADVTDETLRGELAAMVSVEAVRANELTPYKFHVSEDIYTSIILHSDKERGWKSVFHAEPLSKMLSPQDLLTWTIQRFKYAGGTLDIAKNDSPLRRTLSFWQKLMYGTTIYSYLAPLWTLILLVMPIVYFFTGISAVTAYDAPFYAHVVPFLMVNRIAFMLTTWGVESWRGEQYYLAFFWTNLQAIVHVLRGKPVKFTVTPKVKQAGNFVRLVWPQLAILSLTAVGIAFRGVLVGFSHSPPGPYVVNIFWGLWNASCLMAMLGAAFYKPES
jgi:cellulose synthase (UDP-forming)